MLLVVPFMCRCMQLCFKACTAHRFVQTGPLRDVLPGVCSVAVHITSSGSRRAYFYEELEVQLVHGSQTEDHVLGVILQPE